MSAIRLAARQLLREPGFTAMVVLTLALGIGASTVIFTVLHGVLFQPLPYPQGDRIVHVSREFFDVLDTQPLLGRSFTRDELRQSGPSAALIGYGYWQRYLAGTPDFAQRTLRSSARAAQAEYRVASEGYFAAMGIPLLRGRGFDRGDDSTYGAITVMAVRRSLLLAGAGIVAGLAVALGASRVLDALLFGIPPHDPVSYGAAAVALLVACAAAAWRPAARAARVDPMKALRSE